MSQTGIVTLLFTDLVDSSGLFSRLGDDAAEAIRRTHFALLREAVSSLGGTEVKNLGDGLMVAFPSAVDAVGCAVAMQQAVDRHNRREQSTQLEVRVGLHVGEAIQEDDDYFGTPVVVAKRLCDQASGGQVLASELVRDLVGSRGQFDFQSLEPVALKGVTLPVPACQVAWEHSEPASLPLPSALQLSTRDNFVGRDKEWANIIAAWQEAASGQRQAVLIGGEPGIGKTRLATELAARAHSEGACVLYGRCDEDLGLAYQPFVQAIGRFVALGPLEDLRAHAAVSGGELSRLVPDLARRLPNLPAPAPADPDGERYRLFEAVVDLLTTASASSPVVLVLDDLHWAAKPTLLMLRHLLRGSSESALLVVGTYRDTELGRTHPLAEVLADLRREPAVRRLSLTGLDERETAAFLEAAAGNQLDESGLALAKAIHAETEGNPFFVGEILRHLIDTGAIDRTGGGWAFRGSIEDLHLPEGVREVIGRRLSRLSADANRILGVAAVIGPGFDIQVLSRVPDTGGGDLLDAMDEAVEARLVLEQPASPGRFRFAHALVRQVLYEELTVARRAHLHTQVGEALEATYNVEPDSPLEELAYHWTAAGHSGDLGKAVRYSARAADRAVGLLAYEEAVGHLERALQAADTPDALADDQRCEMLLALADAQVRAGDPTAANQTLVETAELARKINSAEYMARAAVAMPMRLAGAGVVPGTLDQRLVDLLEDSLAGLEATGDALRARALSRLGVELYSSAPPERIRGFSDEALTIARRIEDPDVLAQVLADRYVALWGPDTVEGRIALAAEVLELAERSGDRDRVVWARAARAVAYQELCDTTAAEKDVAELTELAGVLRQPRHMWLVMLWQATQAIMAGDFAAAERLIDEGLAVGQLVQPDETLHVYGGQLAILRYLQGRLSELEESVILYVDTYPAIRTWRAALAFLYVQADNREKAREQFELLLADGLESIPRDLTWSFTVALLCHICAFVHDNKRAEELYQLYLPYRDRCIVTGAMAAAWGSSARQLGILATVLGRYDEAEEHFEWAITRNRAMGMLPWVVFTQFDYAEMLSRRGLPADLDRARTLKEEAAATAAELGMAGVPAAAAAAIAD